MNLLKSKKQSKAFHSMIFFLEVDERFLRWGGVFEDG